MKVYISMKQKSILAGNKTKLFSIFYSIWISYNKPKSGRIESSTVKIERKLILNKPQNTTEQDESMR